MNVFFGYVIPGDFQYVPQPFDSETRPADCEECGEPMEWNDGFCADPECDCQHYSPRVHALTGFSSCGKEGI